VNRSNRKLLKDAIARIEEERARSFSPETKAKIEEGLDHVGASKEVRFGMKVMLSMLCGSDFDVAEVMGAEAQRIGKLAMPKKRKRRKR